jgi:hypothetical protein
VVTKYKIKKTKRGEKKMVRENQNLDGIIFKTRLNQEIECDSEDAQNKTYNNINQKKGFLKLEKIENSNNISMLVNTYFIGGNLRIKSGVPESEEIINGIDNQRKTNYGGVIAAEIVDVKSIHMGEIEISDVMNTKIIMGGLISPCLILKDSKYLLFDYICESEKFDDLKKEGAIELGPVDYIQKDVLNNYLKQIDLNKILSAIRLFNKFSHLIPESDGEIGSSYFIIDYNNSETKMSIAKNDDPSKIYKLYIKSSESGNKVDELSFYGPDMGTSFTIFNKDEPSLTVAKGKHTVTYTL